MQYSTDGISWSDYILGTEIPVSRNGAIFAKLVDNTGNEGGSATANVANIDTIGPTITTLLNAPSTTTSSINLSIGATDELSGFSKIEWYYKQSTASTYTPVTPVADTEMFGNKAGTKTEVIKETTLSGLNAGTTYNIYAIVYDVAGNPTRYPTSGTKDVSTVAIPGGDGNINFSYSNTNWTNQSVDVTITKTSGVEEYILQYSTDGNTWTDYSSPVPMSTNGKIYARLRDGSGNGGAAKSEDVKIDTEGPEINTHLNSTSAEGTTIALSITVTDSVSGISKIEWYYKKDIDPESEYANNKKTDKYTEMNGSTVGETEAKEITKTITGLTEGTYSIYAEVYDVAGNSTTSSIINVVNELQIGDYVNYEPDIISQSYSLLGKYSGCASDQTISQDKLDWQILKIHEDGSVDLIGTPTEQTVYLSGALGYNNGVYLMHDICKKLYSKESAGIEARSVNIEDFEGNLTEDGIRTRNEYTSDGFQHGTTKTYTGNSTNYPNLYAQEKGSGIDKETVRTDGIGASDEYYTTQTTETSSKATTLTVTYTGYNILIDKTNYGDATRVLPHSNTFWTASRSVRFDSVNVFFGLHCANKVFGLNSVFSANGKEFTPGNRLRPVITLKSSIELRQEGTNSASNPYKIINY